MTKRYYGWKPSKPHNAKKYALYHLKMALRPDEMDLRPKDSPILNQGQYGSCTAHGLAGLVNFLNSGSMFSRAFIYDQERILEGTFPQDEGAEIHDGIKIMYTFGVPLESLFDYTDVNLTTKPSDEVVQQAHTNVISDYFNLETLDDVLDCLASGFPVVFGIQVHESFQSEDAASSGLIPSPGAYDDVVGGHCMKAVGYSMTRKTIIVANSWGTGWGMQGYCEIPMDYFESEASDMWKVMTDTFAQSQVKRN